MTVDEALELNDILVGRYFPENGLTGAIRTLSDEVRRLRCDLQHWKANHRCEVERARVLKDRVDMPIERVRAYELMCKRDEEIERLRAENERLHGESEVTAEYGCFIDYNRHGEDPYPDCELDKGTPNQCTFADALHACGKGKEACKYWRRVK